MLAIFLSLHLLLPFSNETVKEIGMQIWHNECHQSLNGLLSWNAGENFLSLGIGHFIWHPENSSDVFEETFPELVCFLQMRHAKIPKWLINCKHCPWSSKEAFLDAKNSEQMHSLIQLLSETIDLQIAFLFERFQKIESQIIENTAHKKKILAFIETLKKTPQGVYALIDYMNFKGTGLSLCERYNGEGWGLLQVLEQIPSNPSEENIIEAFIKSAKICLMRRVKNAPKERNEERWLKGWFYRLDSYLIHRF